MSVELPKDWRLASLEDCMAAIIDYRGKSPIKTNQGIPLITAKIVKGGRILDPEEYISEADYSTWMRRGIPQSGDVVFTTEAPLGEVAQLGGERVALAQRLITLRGKPGVVHNDYLKYALQSKFVRDQFIARATGTTVTGIRQSELRKVKLPVPSFREQQAIAGVLGGLDEKLELNRRMSQTLEATVCTIFKSWFVDFDPVREGQPWLSEPGVLGDLAGLSKDSLDPALYKDEYFDHYSIPAFDENGLPKLEAGEAIKSNKFLVPRDAILLSKLNPRIPRVWLPAVSTERRSICSTEFLVIFPKEQGADREYLYSLFCSSGFREEFASRVTGTSGSHQRVRPDDLLKFRCEMPERRARQHYASIVGPMLNQVSKNQEESCTVAAIRDALLPKLLSGEIRIKQAEKIIEEVI